MQVGLQQPLLGAEVLAVERVEEARRGHHRHPKQQLQHGAVRVGVGHGGRAAGGRRAVRMGGRWAWACGGRAESLLRHAQPDDKLGQPLVQGDELGVAVRRRHLGVRMACACACACACARACACACACACALACACACACACALACAWHARVHGMHLLPLAHRMHGEAGVAAPARGRLLNDLVEMAGRWRGGCEEMAGRSRGDCREIAGRWHRVVSPMVWCAIRREWGHGRHSHSKPSARAW